MSVPVQCLDCDVVHLADDEGAANVFAQSHSRETGHVVVSGIDCQLVAS